jgi:hypothetical protein
LSAVNSLSPTTNTLIEIHEYEYLKCIDWYILKGQSHKKVGEMRIEGDSLGPT